MSQRTAIVTGVDSGLGGAISQRLARDGAAVAVFDVNGDAAEATAASINAAGGTALGLTVDVTDRAAIGSAVEKVRAQLGRPTILVNSAREERSDAFLDISPETWDLLLAVNLTGTFNCCQAVLPDMIEQGWGRVVNITSSSMQSGAPRMAHYVAANSGVLGLTKCLALEFGLHGITVNTIPPGFIDTPILRAVFESASMDVDKAVATVPVRRIGTPEDVAATCAFLVSDEAGYITGQLIGLNGGRNL
jgi:NAD(P)-dependent dehydrogenase (short-subunit alcohol dehydrogenase family)